MLSKMKHHPLLTAFSPSILLIITTYCLVYIYSNWWFFLYIPTFTLYIAGFRWNDHNELVCPNCGRSERDKTNYYCNECGAKLVFRRKGKVKKGETPKAGIVAIPACSKGHKVGSWDKFCSKCGEKLLD